MARERRRRPSIKKLPAARLCLILLKTSALVIILAGLTAVAALAGIFSYYNGDLPRLLERNESNPLQLCRTISDDNKANAPIHVPEEPRKLVPLAEIPPIVQHSFIAAEDSQFLAQSSPDHIGLLRTTYDALRYDQQIPGTSTITQQLIKNQLATRDGGHNPKVQELILAGKLERNLEREEILCMYLNTIYLGDGAQGVEEASLHYFDKSVRDLEIQEAALLAGLTVAPESASPYRDVERAMQRRSFVLRRLWEKGFIDERSYHDAMETRLVIVSRSEIIPSHYQNGIED